ncbi:MAG: hypothetical protein ABIA04_08355 [Pseudomonadota bacterium]
MLKRTLKIILILTMVTNLAFPNAIFAVQNIPDDQIIRKAGYENVNGSVLGLATFDSRAAWLSIAEEIEELTKLYLFPLEDNTRNYDFGLSHIARNQSASGIEKAYVEKDKGLDAYILLHVITRKTPPAYTKTKAGQDIWNGCIYRDENGAIDLRDGLKDTFMHRFDPKHEIFNYDISSYSDDYKSELAKTAEYFNEVFRNGFMFFGEENSYEAAQKIPPGLAEVKIEKQRFSINLNIKEFSKLFYGRTIFDIPICFGQDENSILAEIQELKMIMIENGLMRGELPQNLSGHDTGILSAYGKTSEKVKSILANSYGKNEKLREFYFLGAALGSLMLGVVKPDRIMAVGSWIGDNSLAPASFFVEKLTKTGETAFVMQKAGVASRAFRFAGGLTLHLAIIALFLIQSGIVIYDASKLTSGELNPNENDYFKSAITFDTMRAAAIAIMTAGALANPVVLGFLGLYGMLEYYDYYAISNGDIGLKQIFANYYRYYSRPDGALHSYEGNRYARYARSKAGLERFLTTSDGTDYSEFITVERLEDEQERFAGIMKLVKDGMNNINDSFEVAKVIKQIKIVLENDEDPIVLPERYENPQRNIKKLLEYLERSYSYYQGYLENAYYYKLSFLQEWLAFAGDHTIMGTPGAIAPIKALGESARWFMMENIPNYFNYWVDYFSQPFRLGDYKLELTKEAFWHDFKELSWNSWTGYVPRLALIAPAASWFGLRSMGMDKVTGLDDLFDLEEFNNNVFETMKPLGIDIDMQGFKSQDMAERYAAFDFHFNTLYLHEDFKYRAKESYVKVDEFDNIIVNEEEGRKKTINVDYECSATISEDEYRRKINLVGYYKKLYEQVNQQSTIYNKLLGDDPVGDEIDTIVDNLGRQYTNLLGKLAYEAETLSRYDYRSDIFQTLILVSKMAEEWKKSSIEDQEESIVE